MTSFLLDGLLAGLLFVTIIYAAILDRRLRTFRQAREEMQALLGNFTAATVQAQSGITALREASETTAAELKAQLDRGKALRDDVAFLIDRGTELANRLEGGISAARSAAKTADMRGKPAVRLAEAVARKSSEARGNDARANEARSTARPGESRISELRAEPRAADTRGRESRGGDKTDVARDYLRALRAAR